MSEQPGERVVAAVEPREVPWLSVVFASAPLLPLVFGAAGAWLLVGRLRAEEIALTLLFAAAILSFLAGVRRGVSFRTPGGPTAAQIATMFVLFVLAFVASACVLYARSLPAAVLLALGYCALAVLDPIAARRDEAPLFFARLRPLQMPVAALSLIAIAASLLRT